MATRILLIRHGETDWNRSKVFRGTYDVPLNDRGRRQAALLADALRGRAIDAAYSSPLSRATETASIVLAGHGVRAVEEPGLTDIDYGDWTGVEDAEVARRWPEQHGLWATRPAEARIPGGQSLRAVYGRAFAAMGGIADRHDGQTVALFAHRVVNKVLVLAALGLGPERFGFVIQGNCCLNEIERTADGYVIHVINDTSHVTRGGADVLTVDF